MVFCPLAKQDNSCQSKCRLCIKRNIRIIKNANRKSFDESILLQKKLIEILNKKTNKKKRNIEIFHKKKWEESAFD